MFILRSRGLENGVKGIVVLNGVIFASLVGLGYLFMTMFGVVGVGCVCVGVMVWTESSRSYSALDSVLQTGT